MPIVRSPAGVIYRTPGAKIASGCPPTGPAFYRQARRCDTGQLASIFWPESLGLPFFWKQGGFCYFVNAQSPQTTTPGPLPSPSDIVTGCADPRCPPLCCPQGNPNRWEFLLDGVQLAQCTDPSVGPFKFDAPILTMAWSLSATGCVIGLRGFQTTGPTRRLYGTSSTVPPCDPSLEFTDAATAAYQIQIIQGGTGGDISATVASGLGSAAINVFRNTTSVSVLPCMQVVLANQITGYGTVGSQGLGLGGTLTITPVFTPPDGIGPEDFA